ALDQVAMQVGNPYIGIVVALLVLAFWVATSRLPEVKGDEEETADHESVSSRKSSVSAFPHVFLGFVALFFYVRVEVIAGDTIIAYGASLGVPLATAKFFTSFTMVAMVAGYIIGIFAIPKLFSQETALKGCAVLGIVLT